MAGLLDRILDYVAAAPALDASDPALPRAERSIADTLAVMMAGARSEVAAPLVSYASGQGGGVPLLGTGLNAAPETAALVNGAFGHAFDFDDGFPGYPVHASNVAVAALIAAMGAAPVRGVDFTRAYAVGVEVAVAVGRRIGIRHYERGFHATGTIGVFAGVAAQSALLGAEPATTRNAFAIAASAASGLQRNFGTMVKPLHAGWAARSAVAAVALARAGLAGHHDALEGPDGFFAAYGDSGDPSASLAPPAFDALRTTGLGLKKFPCVNACHRPIDALLTLRRTHGLEPENVRAILCRVPPGSLRPIKYVAPATPHEAKFSMHYLLAAALADGRIDLGSFTEAAASRTELHPLFDRIELREDGALAGPPGETKGPGTRGRIALTVETVDGRRLEAEVEFAPGNPRREMTRADLAEKFAGCAMFAGVAADRATALADRVLDLRAVDDMRALLDTLRP